MRNFICNELEPLAYLIFMAVVMLAYNRHKTFSYKVLAVFYAFAAITIYAGIFIKSIYNNWSYNLVFLVNVCVFSWYFYKLLYGNLKKKIVVACAILNVCVLLYFDMTNDFIDDFNGYAYGVSFITIVLFTLFYYHQLLGNVKEDNVLLDFDFWLISSYLFYCLGSFFIVIYYEHVSIDQRGDVWGIQNAILFICSLILLWAYISAGRKAKTIA